MTKVDELRGFPNEEILSRLDEAKEELFNLRFQNATGQLENYKQMGLVKKEISRLETIVRERELGIEMAPKPAESAGKKRRWRKTKTDEEVDASMQARAEGTEEEELETEDALSEEVDDELQEEGKQ